METQKKAYPPEFDPTLKIVRIDTDLLDDERKDIVSLDTDISKLPKHRGKFRNANTDADRYNVFEMAQERKHYEVISLPPSGITTVSNHAMAEEQCREMIYKINEVEELVYCGFDTEGDGANTFQTSILLHGDDKARKYERNILFQMKVADSVKEKTAHILKDGVPPAMFEFFTHPRVVFVGKEIRKDIRDAAAVLGIDEKARGEMKYVELDQVFRFIFNL